MMYDKDPLSALEAITAAQWLAFAPLAFQATAVMRDRGVLAALAKAGPSQGCSIDEVAATTGLSVYAVRVLLEAGLGLHIVWRRDGRYFLGKLGRFLLDDEMTRVNFDFTRDVCYQAAAHLDESLREGRPAGLKELGPWGTLYQGLSVMPEPARPKLARLRSLLFGPGVSRGMRAPGAPIRPRACSISAATPANGRSCASRVCRRCKSDWWTCRHNSNAPARDSSKPAWPNARSFIPRTCWIPMPRCRRATI